MSGGKVLGIEQDRRDQGREAEGDLVAEMVVRRNKSNCYCVLRMEALISWIGFSAVPSFNSELILSAKKVTFTLKTPSLHPGRLLPPLSFPRSGFLSLSSSMLNPNLSRQLTMSHHSSPVSWVLNLSRLNYGALPEIPRSNLGYVSVRTMDSQTQTMDKFLEHPLHNPGSVLAPESVNEICSTAAS
jgi:hypothetical protein